MTAGEALRRQLDDALRLEGKLAGLSRPEFTELDLAHVDAAVEAADSIETLTARIAVLESDPGSEPGVLVKLLAERRFQRGKQLEALRWLKSSLPHAWAGEYVDPQRQLAGRQGRIGRPGRG